MKESLPRPLPVGVRPAKKPDVPAIVRIGKENFPASNLSEQRMLQRMLRGHVILLAEMNGLPVGFIDLRPGRRQMLITGLATSRGFEGIGVGSALLKHAVGFARGSGKLGIVLRVSSGNKKAISLYRKHGFSVVGKKTGPDGSGILTMSRPSET